MADLDKKSAVNLAKPRIKTVSIQELEKRLKEFEQKHNMTSNTFYQKATDGVLDEKDDFITWLGHYEAYLKIKQTEVGCKT